MDQAIKNLFFDACNNAFRWGPGLVIALIMLYGLYKGLIRIGEKVGLKILGALEKPAAALNQQAESMDRLTHSIQEYVGRDQMEHKEMIILQKVILERIENLKRGQGDGA